MIDWMIMLLTTWQFWAIAGGILVTLEIFDGNGIAVSLGISALILAGLIVATKLTRFTFVPNWQLALLEYATISVVLAHFIRKLPIFRGDTPDVNDY